jgi:hypothetical protein
VVGFVDIEKLRLITSSCDFSHQTVNDLKNQIAQIINYKKKAQAASGNEHLMLKEIEELKKNIANFETINANLSSSIKELKELCHEAHHVLSRYAEAKPGAKLAFGGAIQLEEEETDQ